MKYFAYGSNMDPDQMKKRCPESIFDHTASLPDYELAFSRKSTGWDCGVADVVPREGLDVWGAVYEITEADLFRLDKCERYNQPGKNNAYERLTMTVYADGDETKPLEALIYIAVAQESPPLPNQAYKDVILAGARYRGLPAEYIEQLENIEVEG